MYIIEKSAGQSPFLTSKHPTKSGFPLKFLIVYDIIWMTQKVQPSRMCCVVSTAYTILMFCLALFVRSRHKMVEYFLSGFHLYANHSKSTASKSQVGFLDCYHQRLQGIKEPPKMTCEENGIEKAMSTCMKNCNSKTVRKSLC